MQPWPLYVCMYVCTYKIDSYLIPLLNLYLLVLGLQLVDERYLTHLKFHIKQQKLVNWIDPINHLDINLCTVPVKI